MCPSAFVLSVCLGRTGCIRTSGGNQSSVFYPSPGLLSVLCMDGHGDDTTHCDAQDLHMFNIGNIGLGYDCT